MRMERAVTTLAMVAVAIATCGATSKPSVEVLPRFDEHVWVDQLPRVKYAPPPRWPTRSFTAPMSASVVVDALVDSHGRVRATWVSKSVPPFDAYAVEAVRQYRFVAAHRNGMPVAVWVSVPVHFTFH